MSIFNRFQTFATNGTVDAASLHNLIDATTIRQGLITSSANTTSVGTNYELLIADMTNANANPNAVTVYDLFQDALTAGTYTNANISEALSYGTATGTRLVSTNATITTGTITTGTITTGVIPTLTSSTATFGTTTSTAATITSGTITNLASTTGTIATLNSTTSTIATLNSTTGTITNLSTTLAGDFTISSGTGTLGTTGVTAGTYGDASAIPFLTVDAKGRITSATSGTFSSTPPANSVTFNTLSTSATEADNVAKRTAKAWVNFDGTGTPAIRNDFNVSSITDHDIGKYTVNFRSNLSNNTYSIAGMCAPGDADSNGYTNIGLEFNSTYSTSAARITCLGYNVFIDPAIVCVSIFGS